MNGTQLAVYYGCNTDTNQEVNLHPKTGTICDLFLIMEVNCRFSATQMLAKQEMYTHKKEELDWVNKGLLFMLSFLYERKPTVCYVCYSDTNQAASVNLLKGI